MQTNALKSGLILRKDFTEKRIILTKLKHKDKALQTLTKACDLDPKDLEIQQALEKTAK